MTKDRKLPANLLFRAQVLSKTNQALGSIRLAQPVSSWVVVSVSVVLASFLVLFVTFGDFSKRVRVPGVTVPVGGSFSVTAPAAGVLSGILVRDGDIVVAGQELFKVSTERRGESGDVTALVGAQLRSRVDSLNAEKRIRASQHREKTASLRLRLENMDAQLVQLNYELTLLDNREALASEALRKSLALQKDGFLASVHTQQKQEDLLDVSARRSNLKRVILQLRSDRVLSSAEEHSLFRTLEADIEQIDRALAGVKQEIVENQNRKEVYVVASRSGKITTLLAGEGQMVSAGQSLASIIPTANIPQFGPSETPQEVQLYAKSRIAGFAASGQSVLIRFHAYPFQKFGLHRGRITEVSATPVLPSEISPNIAAGVFGAQFGGGIAASEPLYRIKVALDSQSVNVDQKAYAIKPGMTLDADIVQDNRKIWEWILEPLLGASKTFE